MNEPDDFENAVDEFRERVMADTFEGIGARALLNKRTDESGYDDGDEGEENAISEMIHVERAVKAAGWRIVKTEVVPTEDLADHEAVVEEL
jgi:hypothetical protein